MDNYDKLLDSALEKISKKFETKKRFQMPQVVSEVQGNKTILKNFFEIASSLRREPNHLAKYFTKELAAPASIQSDTLVLQTKVGRESLQKKLENYVKEFVYCKVCGQPDTKLEKEDRINFLKCDACGARSPARLI
jgi:translation initiation factor 2 subunit 2